MLSAESLSDIETCERRAIWGQEWELEKLHPTKMLYRAIEQAMTQTERPDRGEFAGEIVMELCGDRGLDVNQSYNLYDVGLHHAVLADILTTYLCSRPEAPWRVPEKTKGNHHWTPSAFLSASGDYLVRPVIVDHWSDERKMAESHSWATIGNMVAYKLPMVLEVIVLGASRAGRRYSAWSTGLLHPRNRKLRFQKKSRVKQPDYGFADSWKKVWREEYATISREEWIAAMDEDGMMTELTRRIDVNLPSPLRLGELSDIVERKGEAIHRLSGIPYPSYSGCWWPRPCPFSRCCFGGDVQAPSVATGFVRIER